MVRALANVCSYPRGTGSINGQGGLSLLEPKAGVDVKNGSWYAMGDCSTEGCIRVAYMP